MASTPILPFAKWLSGTNQNSIPANDNSLRHQILNGLVISKVTAAQPASPADGDIYILPATPTGAQWAGFDEDDVVIFMGGTWYAFAPSEGVVVNFEGSQEQWTAAVGWADVGGGGGMTNPMTTTGDLIVGGASGAPTRVAAGTVDYVLTSNGAGAAPSWEPAPSAGGLTWNPQTASYTLDLSDANNGVEMLVGSANNLTVPPNSTAAFPVGSSVLIYQAGAGLSSIVAGAGVTIVKRGSSLDMGGQYALATLVKRATDTWILSGDIAP